MIFPLIAIKKDDQNIYYFESAKPLNQTSQELFDKKIYNQVKFIDSNGFVYDVKNVKKIGLAWLWGFNPFLKGKQIKIALEYDVHPNAMNLDDLKSIVLNLISSKQDCVIDELKGQIFSATTHAEVIKLLR